MNIRVLEGRCRGGIIAAFAAILAATALPAAAAATRPGHLDASFGTGGVVTTELDRLVPQQGVAGGALLQADGKMVIVGRKVPLNEAYPGVGSLVARYNPDGTLDSSFAGGGIVTTTLPGAAIARSVAIQPDGKLVVAGGALAGSTGPATILRYNADGSLDGSFGIGGLVTTDLPDGASASSVAIQPDGKIVVAGEGGVSPGERLLVVARYDGAGALDPSFGSGGIATTDLGAETGGDSAGLLIQPDGKVLAAPADAGANGIALVRYNPDGLPDTSFGAGGTVTTGFGGGIVGPVLQPDGKIFALVAGGLLVRYTADGSLDPTFGNGGATTTGAISVPDALALQADGKLVVAGHGFDAGDQFELARFNGDGTLDSGFGTGGMTSAGFDPGHPLGRLVAVAADPSGRLVAMGSAYYLNQVKGFSYGSELALARFDPSGSLDPTFGVGGKVTTPTVGNDSFPASADAHLIAAGRGGRFVAAGRTGHRWAVVGYTADGDYDPSFGDAGRVSLSQTCQLLVQPDRKVVAVQGNGYLTRYTSGGSPDPTFGTAGVGVATRLIKDRPISGGALEPNGKVVIAASAGRSITVARYLPNGTPDRSLDTDGRVTLHLKRGKLNAKGVVVERGGRVVVAERGLLIGVRPNGRIDRSFGHRGFVSVPVGRKGGAVEGILRARGGKLVVFGERRRRVALFRFRPNGAPDRSFGQRGHVFNPVGVGVHGGHWAAVQRNGKVVLGLDFGRKVGVLRLNRHGSRDRSFGRRGRAVSRVAGRANAVTVAPGGRILVAGEQDGKFLIAGFVG